MRQRKHRQDCYSVTTAKKELTAGQFCGDRQHEKLSQSPQGDETAKNCSSVTTAKKELTAGQFCGNRQHEKLSQSPQGDETAKTPPRPLLGHHRKKRIDRKGNSAVTAHSKKLSQSPQGDESAKNCSSVTTAKKAITISARR